MKPNHVNALFLHRDLPFHGGVPKSILYFARHRDPNRVRMWAGSLAAPTPEMVEAMAEAGTEVISLGDDGYIRPSHSLKCFITGHAVNVVVCGSFKSYLVAKLACWRSSCRVVFWMPGLDLVVSGRLRRWLFHNLARRDTLVFISEAVKRAHSYGAHRGEEYVIYYGIEDPNDTAELMPYGREQRVRFGVDAADVIIGYIAEFIPWKDHATLLAAFDTLALNYPNLHLILIGTGQDYAKVMAESASLSAGSRIHFLGSRNDARRILGLLDIYVHPSRGEGLGLAVVEAMLAGLPVVASDEGALPEFIHDRETGLLFTGGDSADLADRIEELVRFPRRGQELGQRARTHCLETFAPARFAEEMTRVLEGKITAEHG